MNREIDEVIELLKPLSARYFWNDKWAGKQVEQALALLESAKAQPEPMEFSRETKAYLGQISLESVAKRGHPYDVRDLAVCKGRLERACDIIDRLTEENKAKDEEIENLKLIVRGLQICNNLGLKKETKFTRNFRHLLQTGNGAGSSTYEAVYESAEESCSIIERLTEQLAKAASQNYCTICGKTLDGYIPPEQAKAGPKVMDDELDYLTAENERLAKDAYLLPFYQARMEREIVRQVELTAENEELKKRANVITCSRCNRKFTVDRTSGKVCRVPPEQAELTPDEIKRANGIVAACDGDVTLAGAIEIMQRNDKKKSSNDRVLKGEKP